MDLHTVAVGQAVTPAQCVMQLALRDSGVLRLPPYQVRVAKALAQTSNLREAAAVAGIAHGTIKVYLSRMHTRGLSNAQIILIGAAFILEDKENNARDDRRNPHSN